MLFLDEVHELRKKADAFLNFFEPKERRAVGRRAVGDFADATILAATTDRGKLPAPFLSRFRMIDLEPYSQEEIADIIAPVFQGHQSPRELLLALARVGRLTPRTALERAKEVLDRHRFSAAQYPLTLTGLRKIAGEQWKVDDNGLTENDRRYLRALKDSPRGLGALTALLPVGKEEIERVIEPFLLQLEAIRMTPTGRALTEQGRILAGG